MLRKLARIVTVDAISPIPKADLLEAAHVGGWVCVVKKDVFRPGDMGVYFEIDSFLPTGEPAWQFLVEKQSRDFAGTMGHALHSVRLRGRLSQGLLLPLSDLSYRKVPVGGKPFPFDQVSWQPGQDVTSLLGVLKYEKPLPQELLEIAKGYLPSGLPETDQERIQNLSEEFGQWQLDAAQGLTWEETEKLEGESCTFALLEYELHACSRRVSFRELPASPHWAMAHKLQVREKLRSIFGHRSIALQGELVGPGIEGNIYRLAEPQFYLYDVYDPQAGEHYAPAQRRELARELGLLHVPVLNPERVLDEKTTGEGLLLDADGPSMLLPTQRREGKVYKANGRRDSFKVVSNAYLLGQKL